MLPKSLFYIVFVGSSEEVVKGDIEIVSKFYQRFIICFAFAVLVSTDAILVHVQIKCEL